MPSMKRQSSIRSLGQLLANPFTFSHDDSRRPLQEPSVVVEEESDDDSFGIIENSSDPLIGKMIDADQSIEDEVRSLLGLSAGPRGEGKKSEVKSPPSLLSDRMSNSVTNLACGDEDPMRASSRRSSLSKSNSGDGAGNRYVRKKNSGSRQRSMRRNTASSNPPDQELTEDLKHDKNALDLKQEQPVQDREQGRAVPEDGAVDGQDRRRTLTKIRKSSRRLIVATMTTLTSDDNVSKDSNDTTDLEMPIKRELKSSANVESSRAKSRSHESKDERAESRTNSNRSHDTKSRPRTYSTNSSGEVPSSSRRQSLTSTRPSSRRVSEDRDRRLSLRDKKTSSRRLSDSGDGRSSRQISLRDKKPSSRQVTETELRKESRRSLMRDQRPSSRLIAEQGTRESTRDQKRSTVYESDFIRDKHQSDDDELFYGQTGSYSRPFVSLDLDMEVSHNDASGHNVQPNKASLREMNTRPSFERRPSQKSSRQHKSLVGQHQACVDDDQNKKLSTPRSDFRRSSSSYSFSEIGDYEVPSMSVGPVTNDALDQGLSSEVKQTHISSGAVNLTSTTNPMPNTEVQRLSDEPRNSNYLKLKKRTTACRSTQDSYYEAKLVSDVPVEFVTKEAEVRGDAEKATTGTTRTMVDETQGVDLGLPLASEKLTSGSEDSSVARSVAACRDLYSCTHDFESSPDNEDKSISVHGPESELSEADTLQSSVGKTILHSNVDGSHSNKALESKPENTVSQDPKPDITESQKEQLKMELDLCIQDHVGVDRLTVKTPAEGTSNETRTEPAALTDNNPSLARDIAQESVASRVKAFEALSINGTKPTPVEILNSQSCSENKQKSDLSKDLPNLQIRIASSPLTMADSVEVQSQPFCLTSSMHGQEAFHQRSISVSEQTIHGPKVENDGETGCKNQKETRYDRRRSEGAVFVQSSLSNLLLSPLSANSCAEDRKRNEPLRQSLKQDRWAAISPMGHLSSAQIVDINDKPTLSLQSPQSVSGPMERQWASMSPRRRHDVAHHPVADASQTPTQDMDLNLSRWSAFGAIRSTSETRTRRKSLGDVREFNVQISFDTNSSSGGSFRAFQSFEASKQRFREDRDPMSPIVGKPKLSTKEPQKRRKTLSTLTGNDYLLFRETCELVAPRIDTTLFGSQIKSIEPDHREDRWAPISPMRPILPVLLKNSGQYDALPGASLIEDAAIKSERWAASAENELKHSDSDEDFVTKVSDQEQRRPQSVYCIEESSMNSFGLIEDDDDIEARLAAHHAAMEHSLHQESVAQSRSENGASGTFGPSNIDDDEYCCMIARKTALELLIGQELETLNKLKTELKHVENRLSILGDYR